MASTAKAGSTARELVNKWTKYLGTGPSATATLPSIVLTADSSGWPVITLSADATPATGEKVVVVKIKTVDLAYSQDILGNASIPFSPHRIQICTEANFAGTTDNVADILSPIELLPVIALAAKTGMVLEWHVTANGTVPSSAAIDAGTNLKATFRDLYAGNQSSS